MNFYAIYDSVADEYVSVFFAKNIDVVKRQFRNMTPAERSKSPFFQGGFYLDDLGPVDNIKPLSNYPIDQLLPVSDSVRDDDSDSSPSSGPGFVVV